jgi:hypothetical protein
MRRKSHSSHRGKGDGQHGLWCHFLLGKTLTLLVKLLHISSHTLPEGLTSRDPELQRKIDEEGGYGNWFPPLHCTAIAERSIPLSIYITQIFSQAILNSESARRDGQQTQRFRCGCDRRKGSISCMLLSSSYFFFIHSLTISIISTVILSFRISLLHLINVSVPSLLPSLLLPSSGNDKRDNVTSQEISQS